MLWFIMSQFVKLPLSKQCNSTSSVRINSTKSFHTASIFCDAEMDPVSISGVAAKKTGTINIEPPAQCWIQEFIQGRMGGGIEGLNLPRHGLGIASGYAVSIDA